MKYLLTENQLKNFIKSNFGVDLTGKIQMVTNKWEIPMEFEYFMSDRILNTYLNKYGPMYVIQIGKYKYLAQDRGKEEGGWFIVDQSDTPISEFKLMQFLGIESLGLSFDNLLDEYFTEESINEQVTDEPEDNITNIIQSYLDMNLPNYYGIKRFWVDYNKQWDDYIINIFFDRQLAIKMGGKINTIIRKANNQIGHELNLFFEGVNIVLHQHFED